MKVNHTQIMQVYYYSDSKNKTLLDSNVLGITSCDIQQNLPLIVVDV